VQADVGCVPFAEAERADGIRYRRAPSGAGTSASQMTSRGRHAGLIRACVDRVVTVGDLVTCTNKCRSAVARQLGEAITETITDSVCR